MQYEQRQCLLENDSKVYADMLEKLVDFQQQLDDIWRASCWISNIASIARDRNNKCALALSRVLMQPSANDCANYYIEKSGGGTSDVGYHSDQVSEASNLDYCRMSFSTH